MNCGSCQHWRQRPADPANLAAPAQGDCLGQPPQVVAVPTAAGLQIIPLYPVLPEGFQSCALYVPSPASLGAAGNHKH